MWAISGPTIPAQAQHPKSPVPLVGRDLVFEVLAPGSPVVSAMQLVLAEAYFAVAAGH